MKKLTFFLVAMMVFFAMVNAKNWQGLQSSIPLETQVNLIESNIQSTTLEFKINGYFTQEVETPNGTETVVSLPNNVQIMEKGMPDLGKVFTNIVIDDTRDMQLKVVSSDYIEVDDISVAPSKGHFTRDIDPESVPFEYSEAYSKDAFYPSNIAQLEEPFILRDFRGQTVTIFPFSYNPVERKLRIYTNIVIKAEATDIMAEYPLARNKSDIKIEPEFKSIYNRFFSNIDATSKNYQLLDGEEGSLLIIAHDDFVDAMQPFIDWKRQTGRKTEIVPRSEAGTTASAVKDYVLNYYNENDDFSYLLLIGDAPQMPPLTTSNGHSDNAFGYLSGNDAYNEIFVGRFSAENVSHVETQVERMIHYERDITTADTWLSSGLGIARNEGDGNGHNGESDYAHMDLIRDTLLNFTYNEVHRRYDGGVPGMPNATASDISQDINNGVSVINFCNHGSTTGWSVASYSISHVNTLTNSGKLPFIWSVACVNGNFVSNFCFAESWMRATHDDAPAGAVGTMMSTINQPWQPPQEGQDEMVSLLAEQSIVGYETIKRTYGGISINGSMAMIPAYPNQGVLTHDTWVLFGDPTLMVRTQAPEEFELTYNPVMLLGNNSFAVNAANGEAATVALTRYDEINEEVVIVAKGYITDGVADLTFMEEIDQPMNLTLTVTGFNKVTYINNEIEVIPPDGPYVVLDGYNAANESNSFVYGQNVNVDVSLKNVGVEDASDVTATLSIDDPYFSVLDESPVSFGDITSGETENISTVESAFTIVVSDDVPDGYSITAPLFITDGTDIWESTMRITASAPVLAFEEVIIIDDGSLNPGYLDPGEVGELNVVVRNNGTSASPVGSAQIMSESQFLLFSTMEDDLIAIEPGDTDTVAFTVTASMQTPPEAPAQLDISAATGSYGFDGSLEIIIGQAPVYSDGDIPTTYSSNPTTSTIATSPGVMTVTIPENAVITGVDVEYSMTSQNGAWMSEQRSYLRCVSEGGTAETSVTSGPSTNSAGTHDYNRSGLTIANDVTGGGDITFELHAFRTWGGSGTNTEFGLVDNNTWKIVVQYEIPGHNVTFVVEDTEGNPLEDAEITINGFTHQPGDYVIENVVDGTHNFSVGKYAYTTDSGEFTVDGADIELTAVLEALPTYSASFSITDTQGNEITNAVISLNEVDYEAGTYVIDNLVADTYNYAVSMDGYQTSTGSFDIVDTNIELVAQIQELFQVTFEVTDGTSMVTDAVISIEGQPYTAGMYVMDNMMPGVYEYTVTKAEHYPTEGQIEITDNDMIESVTLVPWPKYFVEFNIEDVYGSPINEADVYIDGSLIASDNFISDGLFSGNYEYSVQKEGYLPVHGSFELIDQDISLDIALQDIYNIEFNISNDYGVVEDAIITINDDVYESGVTVFSQMIPGAYSYTIEKEGFYPAEGTIDLESEDMSIDIYLIEIKLEALFVVTDQDGNAIDDAIILFEGVEYEAGEYLMIGIDNGLYNYTVSKEGYHEVTGSIFMMNNDISIDITLTAIGTGVESNLNDQLSVYPNPFKNELRVNTGSSSNYDVYIIDIIGNIVYTENELTGESELNLGALPAGNYFIRIVSDNNTITRKITRIVR